MYIYAFTQNLRDLFLWERVPQFDLGFWLIAYIGEQHFRRLT